MAAIVARVIITGRSHRELFLLPSQRIDQVSIKVRARTFNVLGTQAQTHSDRPKLALARLGAVQDMF